ncbi:hypothetical protein BC829DRAFT_386674 [Chytridium lagenaria]|nr:hypothetical protein BC829DRAFT_386674 [Chytridium lagenaria]
MSTQRRPPLRNSPPTEKINLSISDFASSDHIDNAHTLSMPSIPTPSALSNYGSIIEGVDSTKISASLPALSVRDVVEDAGSPTDDVPLTVFAAQSGAVSPGSSPTDNVSLAVFAAGNPAAAAQLRQDALREQRDVNPIFPQHTSHPPHPPRERRGSNASASTFASFSPQSHQPLDANAQALAATVAHLILLRFEPWMAETSRTLRAMDHAIYNLENKNGDAESGFDVRGDTRPPKCDHCGHDVGIGKSGTLLFESTRRHEERILDAEQQATADAQHAQQNAGNKKLLNLPGLTGDGAVPGPGQARIETVPKRQQCLRCDGFGFIHNPKSKKKHNQAKNVQCKKCLTCKLCTGTGILMNVQPCKDCGANGFLHPGSETCRLGVGCEEGCNRPSPVTGWIPTKGLLANHPELRSPVGDRPGRPRSASRSHDTVNKRPGSLLNSDGSLDDASLSGSRADAFGDDGRSILSNHTGQVASSEHTLQQQQLSVHPDSRRVSTSSAAREFSRSPSAKSFAADTNTLGVESFSEGRRASATSESSRSVAESSDLSPQKAPARDSTASAARRPRSHTTSSIAKNPLDFIKGGLSRSGSQKSFDTGSIVTIPVENSPFNALKTAFSRSSSTKSFNYEVSDAEVGDGKGLRVADESNRTLSRSTSSKSFAVDVDSVLQAGGQITVE